MVLHPNFPGIKIYAFKRWFKVTTQGPVDSFFKIIKIIRMQSRLKKVVKKTQRMLLETLKRVEILVNTLRLLIQIYLQQSRQKNFVVDNDNLPAPENGSNVSRPIDRDTEVVYSQE